MAVTLQGSTLNNIHIGNSGGGGGGAISAVASANATAYETTTTLYPTFADLPTPCSVTVTTGATALVTISSSIYRTVGLGNGILGFAVSGATTMAVSSDLIVSYLGAQGTGSSACATFKVTGLTPGVNTFTLKYCTDGGTAGFQKRNITVMALA